MRKSLILNLSVSALALSLGSPAFAQTSTTPVIGFYKQNLAAGGNLVVPGFVTKVDFQGQASTQPTVVGTQMTVNQTGAGWAANQFNTLGGALSSHYIEVLDDGVTSHAGLILDIISNNATSLTVEVKSGFAPGAAFKYAIRKHATLATIFPNGAGLNAFEDLVSLYDEVGTESIYQFNGSGWEDFNTAAASDSKVVYPGQGMVISTGGARVITIGGAELSYVKTTPTQVPLYTAPLGVPNIVGLINPLVGTTGADTSPISNFGWPVLSEFEDSIAVLSSDGNLNVVSLYSIMGGAVVDDTLNPVPTTTPIKNGSAVVISIGSTANSVLHQGVVIP